MKQVNYKPFIQTLEAEKYYLLSLEITEFNNQTANTLNSLAILYSKEKKYKKARELFKIILIIFIEKTTKLLIALFGNLFAANYSTLDLCCILREFSRA